MDANPVVMKADAQSRQFPCRHVTVNAAIRSIHWAEGVARVRFLMATNAILNVLTSRDGFDRLMRVMAGGAAKLSFGLNKAAAP